MRPTEATAIVLPNDERRRRVAELLCKAISLSAAKRVVEVPRLCGEVVVSEPVTTTPDDVGSDEHRILDYLELAGRGSPAAIRDALGLSRSATYRALHRLTVAGHIRSSGKTRGLAYQLNDAEPPPHKIALN
jgi:uncharacterized membrane protein